MDKSKLVSFGLHAALVAGIAVATFVASTVGSIDPLYGPLVASFASAVALVLKSVADKHQVVNNVKAMIFKDDHNG